MIETLQQALGTEYRVIKKIGRGGMSTVYLAEEVALGRQVVVKLLARDLVGSMPQGRFKREIMVAANLQHPHILGLITAGEADGLPYFIMPYVEGASLRQMINERGPLPLQEVVAILRDTARACSYAHASGIVHRDIKPDNILLSAGVAMLADFGVAKALSTAEGDVTGTTDSTQTAIGISLGTPTYIAPEQAAADPNTDHRADIYALGATAYEMLCGHPPFEYVTAHELVTAHISEPPRNILELRPDMPPDLAALIMRCLEKNPEDRPQKAEDLVDWLSVSGVISEPTRNRMVRAAVLDSGSGGKTFARTGVAVAIVLIAAVAVSSQRLMKHDNAGDSPLRNSVAVLPFVNTGGDPENEYFADGMTDELTATLAALPGLRVASRTAAFAFKESDAALTEIGTTLHVAHLVEGTVRRSQSRVRMTAQLVNVDDGLAVWSETFDREVDDVFAVQEDVARAITSALLSRLSATVPPPPQMVHRGTRNRDAYDIAMRAKFLMRQRGPQQLREALTLFDSARHLDPSYPAAFAGRADALALLPLYAGISPDSILPEALRAASRAIDLDSSLAPAWASRGNLLNSAWRWDEAAADLQKAIELDPQLPSAHQWLGENMLVNGRIEDAERSFAAAAEMDPMSPIAPALRGVAAALNGNRDVALESASHAIELQPSIAVTHFMAGAARLYLGDLNGARAELETATNYGAVPALSGMLGYVYARLGEEDLARAQLAVIRPGSPNAEAAMAKIHLGLGETEEALRLLSVALQRHDSFFSSEPTATVIFEPVRGNPRFLDLLERAGLSIRP